jgi:hypothetical protein
MAIEMTLDELHNDDDDQNTGAAAAAEPTDPVKPANNNDIDVDPAPVDPVDPEDDAPAIEQFLSQYGISGGIITFEGENGEESTNKHFNDLTNEEQFTVLNELASTGAPTMESKYGLDEDEVGLLNFVRKTGKPVDEALNDLAQERVQQILALRESFDTDYNNMSSEAVTSKWLAENNPDATEEELAEELTRSKESNFFEKNAENIRKGFLGRQENEAAQEEAASEAEREALIEDDRAVIAQTVADMEHVAGFVVDDSGKNEVLGKILEVNKHGDSLFMEEVFSDPEKLFKAAWLFYNTESYLDQLDKKHKKDLANEYQKGRSYATNGLSSAPISGIADKPATTGGVPDPVRVDTNRMTLEDLHREED